MKSGEHAHTHKCIVQYIFCILVHVLVYRNMYTGKVSMYTGSVSMNLEHSKNNQIVFAKNA